MPTDSNSIGPLDPALAEIVARIRAGPPPIPLTRHVEARVRFNHAVLAARERTGVPEVDATEDMLASHGGLSVPVRIYRPGGQGPHPTLLFFHGGGFVLGSVELFDDIARKFCRDMSAVVVSVDYRLAPEHCFPAAHDDALTAALWVIENVEKLGGDRGRVGVTGESAGANLAASTAIALRNQGIPLRGQLLVVPGVDMARDTQLIERRSIDYPMLNAADLVETARIYLGPRLQEAMRCPPSPMHATDLRGLAPAVIAVAGHDPLHDEGVAYAVKLGAAGIPVKLLRFYNMFHPFLGFFEASQGARRANDELCSEFRRLMMIE